MFFQVRKSSKFCIILLNPLSFLADNFLSSHYLSALLSVENSGRIFQIDHSNKTRFTDVIMCLCKMFPSSGPPTWGTPGSATYNPGPHPGAGYCKFNECCK